jgi:hypothetical protein
MDRTEFQSARGIAEFQLESQPVLEYGGAANGAGGPGSRASPDAYLLLLWKQAGLNRGPRFPTQ